MPFVKHFFVADIESERESLFAETRWFSWLDFANQRTEDSSLT